MKKLLGIMVLGLLLSGNAYAETARERSYSLWLKHCFNPKNANRIDCKKQAEKISQTAKKIEKEFTLNNRDNELIKGLTTNGNEFIFDTIAQTINERTIVPSYLKGSREVEDLYYMSEFSPNEVIAEISYSLFAYRLGKTYGGKKRFYRKYKKEITAASNSCSLHIRRGDYISNSKSHAIHGTCNLKYYKEAIKIIKEKYQNPTFFIFSDDPTWTKDNLVLNNAIYINHNCLPHEDIYLMSLCKNNITANSSFSWWGAWLNRNDSKTIIAPKQWFVTKENEIACENWIKI